MLAAPNAFSEQDFDLIIDVAFESDDFAEHMLNEYLRYQEAEALAELAAAEELWFEVLQSEGVETVLELREMPARAVDDATAAATGQQDLLKCVAASAGA